MKWCVPVVHTYNVTSDARDHLARSQLCGIDFITNSGDKTLLSMSSGTIEYVHCYDERRAQDTSTYDSLGRFIVAKYILDKVIVYVRYCHNYDVDIKAGHVIAVGNALGEYGNTGYSFGDHVHVDFWISDADIVDAQLAGMTPCTMHVSPWPGSKLLRNVDVTKALTDLGLDVKRG